MDLRKILKARIEKIADEVKEFHPLLDAIFSKMDTVTHVSYTHGPSERGADFVLTTNAPEFGDVEYIGVIAKIGKITSNISAIEEQIRECMEVRLAEDGGKKIYLSQIWVASTGNISERAREKIFERFRSQKVRFLGLNRIVSLTEKYVPDFGTNLSVKDSSYLAHEREKAAQRAIQFSLLPATAKDLQVETEVVRIDDSEMGGLRGERTAVNILDEIKRYDALLIEAPMGGGKTHLMNQVVQYFANPEIYSDDKIMPIYLSVSEFIRDGNRTLQSLVEGVVAANKLTSDDDRRFLVLLDGLDEVFDDEPDKVLELLSATDELHGEGSLRKVKVVIATRRISDERVEAEVESRYRRYEIRPLSLKKIVSFISEICSTLNIKTRLIEDLKESTLFKVLPKTPIATIILAKLISEGSEEVPANLTELYSQYCELALGRWDIDKGLSSLKEYEASDSIVANIAAYILDNKLDHIAYSEARDQFRQYLSERNLSIDPTTLFNTVLSRSDIFVRRRELDVIAFKHRSFTEFFYAKDLMRRDNVEITTKIFHPYWSNAYFFYVGLKKDCPELLRQIYKMDVSSEEGARFSKLVNTGNFLLAGYKSPYYVVEDGLRTTFSEAREYYLDIRNGAIESFFSQLPPVHLLALFRAILQGSYSYPFFSRAIESSIERLVAQGDLSEGDLYELLMLDATRKELGITRAIEELAKVGKKKDVLPIPIETMICAEVSTNSNQVRLLRPLEKRMRKYLKSSSEFRKAVHDAYYKSLDGKIEYPDKGKRLAQTSKYAGGRLTPKK